MDIHAEKILILDFGSQTTQLIARRVREAQVYCEIHPFNIGMAKIREFGAKGIILSGGPACVLDKVAPVCDLEVLHLGVPVLGICYGMQLMTHLLGGEVERAEGPLTIVDGDHTLPELRNFTVHPTTFTPNRDGIDDRITVNYNLAKLAQVNVYLLGGDGERYPLEEKPGSVKPGEPGNHSYDYEGGVDLGVAPPPDGTYTLMAEALDTVGNRVVETRQLTILDGGVPIVEILGGTAEYSHQAIALGETLIFTVTVANLGAVPVRTSGPPSGTAYTTGQNYNSLGYHEEPGVFRIGLDFEGNSSGRPYPYRWAISDKEYLLPDERFTVVGHLKIVDPPPRINPHYWVGLLHEEVRIVNDHVAPMRITVDF